MSGNLPQVGPSTLGPFNAVLHRLLGLVAGVEKLPMTALIARYIRTEGDHKGLVRGLTQKT